MRITHQRIELHVTTSKKASTYNSKSQDGLNYDRNVAVKYKFTAQNDFINPSDL